MTGTFHEDKYTFLIISRSFLLRIRNFEDKFVQKKQNAHFMFYNFFENRALHEMWKNIVEPNRPQRTIWRMRIACWIPNATNTYREYVLLLFHCSNVCTKAPSCCVTRTLPLLLNVKAVVASSNQQALKCCHCSVF
jgi:hypothetical protein